MYPVSPQVTPYAGMSGTYIPEIWSGKLLVKFYTSTVFAYIANTDYEGEIAKYGDKVKIRTIPDMAIRKYKVGQSLKYDRPKGEVIDLLIDRGEYFAFAINDVEAKQADIAYVDKWSDDASQQMKGAIDKAVLSVMYTSASAYNKGATAGKIDGAINLGVTGAPVALGKSTIIEKLIECGQCLSEQNVPETDRYSVIPAWMGTKIKVSELAEASYSGDGISTERSGRIGKVDHFTLYTSNNILPVVDTSVNCYHAIFGHKTGLTFASQLTEVEKIKNPDDFGDLMRGLQVYGFKVLKAESVGDLYCKKAA
jgi:hypothetical protein